MRIRGIACAAFAISASANAGNNFTGFAANSSFVGANGEYCQLDLYTTFDSPFLWLANLGGTNISLNGVTFADCIQNNSGGGPNFGNWSPKSSLSELDSFVTIGGVIGPSNSTSVDPDWGAPGFNQVGIPAAAGWFNANPPNFQGMNQLISLFDSNGGLTYSGYATHCARFVIPTDLAYGASLSLDPTFIAWGTGLTIMWQADPTAQTFEFATVPAPASALVLIPILSQLRGGRSRRR